MNLELLRIGWSTARGGLTRYTLTLLALLLVASSGYAQTVTTDKDDYAPGEYVIVTGSGWTPGETVEFDFHETPRVCTSDHHYRSTVADENGDIYYDQYLINIKHLGVSFVLTATGQTSGSIATAYFTDANIHFRATGLPNGTDVSVIVIYTPATPTNSPQKEETITFKSQNNGQVAAAEGTQVFWTFKNTSTDPVYINTASTGTQGFTVAGNLTGSNAITGSYSLCSSPSITIQPNNKSITYGEANPTFSVNAQGDGIVYQWQTRANLGAAWTNVGTNANSYTVLNPSVTLSGSQYRVIITGICGTVTSNVVELTVNAKAVVVTPTAGQSKVYGSADPVFTFSNDASLPDAAFTGALGRAAGENVADGPYAYTLGNLSAGSNYSLSLGSNNTFTINA
ncbi:MBG-2 domain-containing protein, partial [Cesiribacter andamanensis]|uniref:MBG-2 domain-containing protein n=1 Tax=Cesiribacter andamanensis TaxID=649507 RepID=UPI00161C05F8